MAFIGYSSCTIDLHSHYRVFYWLNNNEKTFVWSKLKEFLVENHQKKFFEKLSTETKTEDETAEEVHEKSYQR